MVPADSNSSSSSRSRLLWTVVPYAQHGGPQCQSQFVIWHQINRPLGALQREREREGGEAENTDCRSWGSILNPQELSFGSKVPLAITWKIRIIWQNVWRRTVGMLWLTFLLQIFSHLYFLLKSFTRIIRLLLAAMSVNGLNPFTLITLQWAPSVVIWCICMYFPNNAVSCKYLNESYSSHSNEQYFSKYFGNLSFIGKLFAFLLITLSSNLTYLHIFPKLHCFMQNILTKVIADIPMNKISWNIFFNFRLSGLYLPVCQMLRMHRAPSECVGAVRQWERSSSSSSSLCNIDDATTVALDTSSTFINQQEE